MNPRYFFREYAHHKALLLTYAFDPVFFEQLVLPDLWAGRSSDILVLGDRGEIDASVQSAAEQIWNLGRQYLLAGADVPGAFHPKVFVRLGQRDGIVMVGSGNITSSGWGANRELGTAWMVGPDHLDKGGWLHPFLHDVLTWCQGDLERDAVRRFKDVPWLSLTPADDSKAVPVLHSCGARSLASQLAQRWSGRKFKEVKILTGSTDESGTFLKWAHETFGITHATVALTPASASFVVEELAKLPLELHLIAAPSNRPLHAKFYWFDGADGPAAVMGSANCSAAAWRLPPNGGGNVETVVVYDRPETQDFKTALELFAELGEAPAKVLAARPEQKPTPARPKPSFAIQSLRWNSTTHVLTAKIFPVPDPSAQVELRLVERVLPTVRQDMPGEFCCEVTEGLEGTTTLFASAIVSTGWNSYTTSGRWIDDIAALEHASHSARLLEPFKALAQARGSAEQRHILDELQEVAQILFNDPDSARDPTPSGINHQKDDGLPAKPVNPNELIVPLGDSRGELPHLAAVQAGSLSLTGVLRLLFEAETDESRGSAAADDETLDEGQRLTSPSKPQRTDETDRAGDRKKHGAEVEARLRERLATQINTFLTEMSTTAFAERCTATQMVQAVSFPLAVALRGRGQGWVTDELAEKWSLEVFSTLFRGQDSRSLGLLRAVEQRYLQSGQKETYDDVVGNGALWLVLIATLGGTSWHCVGTDIDKALAVREVFNAPQLSASATPDRIMGLLGKIQIDKAKAYVADVAPQVKRLLDEIEHELRQIWAAEMRDQEVRAIIHKQGDLLWRDSAKSGWVVCLKDAQNREGSIRVRLRGLEKDVSSGYYVNVSEVCSRNSRLSDLVTKLRSSVNR